MTGAFEPTLRSPPSGRGRYAHGVLTRTIRPATPEEVATLNRRSRTARPDWLFIGCSLTAGLAATFVLALVVALVVWFGGAADPRASFLSAYREIMLWCLAVLGTTVAVLNVGNQLSRMVGRRFRKPPQVEELHATATRAALAPGVLEGEVDLMFLLVEPDRVLAIDVGDVLPERVVPSIGSEFVRVRVESGAAITRGFSRGTSPSAAEIPVTVLEIPEDAQVLLAGVVDRDVRLADLPQCVRRALGGE